MRLRVLVRCAGAVLTLVAASEPCAAQQAPAPAASPSPTPRPSEAGSPAPGRLRLDLDRHVNELLERRQVDGRLRFQDRIEVTDRSQEALEELLRGLDLACSPSAGGPPPTSELNDFRAVEIPPYADFVAAAKAIFKALKKINPWQGPPDWYLYGVRQAESVRFLVRKGELPASLRLATPGTSWDEIARFHSSGEATDALRRLERGYKTLTREMPGQPAHPSMRIQCLPQPRR